MSDVARSPLASAVKVVLIGIALAIGGSVLFGVVECARAYSSAVPLAAAPLEPGESYGNLVALGDDLAIGVSYLPPVRQSQDRSIRNLLSEVWILKDGKIWKAGRRPGALRDLLPWRDGLLVLRAEVHPTGRVTSVVTLLEPRHSEIPLGSVDEDLQHLTMTRDGGWAAYGGKYVVETSGKPGEPWRTTRLTGLEPEEWISGLVGFGTDRWRAVSNQWFLRIDSRSGVVQRVARLADYPYPLKALALDDGWVSRESHFVDELVHLNEEGIPETVALFDGKVLRRLYRRGAGFVLFVGGGSGDPYASWVARYEQQKGWQEVDRKRLPLSTAVVAPWRGGVAAATLSELYFLEL